MAPRTIAYRVEVTSFDPAAKSEVHTYLSAEEVTSLIRSLPPADRVLFVAVLDLDKGVDYGNFYLFTNANGAAHVMVHEHREFLPRDLSHVPESGDIGFLDEDANRFNVRAEMTTTQQRGISALEYWLPRQEHWAGYTWE